MNSVNSNVKDISCSFNGQGLLEVTFTCNGSPEFPTARNPNYRDKIIEAIPSTPFYSIYGDLRQVFRNGPPTTNLIPVYSYEGGKSIWRCTSLCLQDGSPYFPDGRLLPFNKYPFLVDQRQKISSCSYKVSDGLPLVYVTFNGVGDKLIYPTALAKNANAFDKPIDAFSGGLPSTHLQASWQRNDERVGWVWDATTVLHLDNSPYFPNVERDVCEIDKLRIFDTSVKIDDELSLRYVTFRGVGTVKGQAIYPTALVAGKALTDKPVDAYFGGTESVHLNCTWQRNDERIGWIWETTTVLNLDGSAITEEIKVLSSYIDIAEVPIVGKVDATWDTGHELTPPITHKIRATVELALIPATLLVDTALPIPYHATEWASYGAVGALESGEIVDTQAGASGYLIGDVESAAAGTEGHTYLGAKCGSMFDVYGESTPSYDAYIENIYTSVLDCSVSVLFTSVEGVKYYLRKKVTGNGKESSTVAQG